jgi:hypothetical protein
MASLVADSAYPSSGCAGRASSGGPSAVPSVLGGSGAKAKAKDLLGGQ